MTIDLDNLDLKELRELQAKVERAINSFEDRKRREAMAAVEQAAREHGFNLTELTGGKPRKTGTVAPKYVNPDDSTVTWTGRGRKPRWVQAHLDKGGAMEELAI